MLLFAGLKLGHKCLLGSSLCNDFANRETDCLLSAEYGEGFSSSSALVKSELAASQILFSARSTRVQSTHRDHYQLSRLCTLREMGMGLRAALLNPTS